MKVLGLDDGDAHAHGLQIRPQHRNRPQQPTEYQRQQAQHVNRIFLRMMALYRRFLREDVQHPKEINAPRRQREQDEDREPVRHLVGKRSGQRSIRGCSVQADRQDEHPSREGLTLAGARDGFHEASPIALASNFPAPL